MITTSNQLVKNSTSISKQFYNQLLQTLKKFKLIVIFFRDYMTKYCVQ